MTVCALLHDNRYQFESDGGGGGIGGRAGVKWGGDGWDGRWKIRKRFKGWRWKREKAMEEKRMEEKRWVEVKEVEEGGYDGREGGWEEIGREDRWGRKEGCRRERGQ